MSKLFDIKGYFDSSYEYQFNDRDMWEGKILLEDDGWFEGVVKDVSSSYQEDRFVFGVYHPGKVIELFKWTPTSFSSPFVFHGNKSEVGYQGEFEVIGLMGSMPYGVSRITPEEVVLGKDEEQVEIDDVKRRIEAYKVFLMDESGRSFYDNSMAMRNVLCDNVLRCYEGRGYTEEEMAAIANQVGPINDRVIQATGTEMTQLVKKLQRENPNFFSDADADDDELPF